MADTSYLTKDAERYIIARIQKEVGEELSKKNVVVGHKMDGSEAHFEFDGVSQDEKSVGVLVSTSHSKKPGVLHKLYRDASLLNRAGFKTKIMAFVDKKVWDNFCGHCDGLVDLQTITPKFFEELPEPMRTEISKIQKNAKREVGDKGKLRALGANIERVDE